MKLSYLNPLLKLKVFISILFFVVCINKSQASIGNIDLSITVTEPPSCNFFDGNSLDINFGLVQQAQIDGKSYKKTHVNYDLICTNLSSKLLKMKLNWNNFSVNGVDAIKTNRDNLGIAIYQGDNILSNNSTINFIYGVMPDLYAVPIKPDGSTLSDAGNFSAEMIMTIEYQ